MVQLVPCGTVFTPAKTSTSATTTSASTKIRAPDIAVSPQASTGSLAHESTRGLVEPRVRRQPAVEKTFDPAVQRRVVKGMHRQMHAALLGTGKFQSLRRFQRPDVLHLERDLRMELEAEGVGAAAESLHREDVVGRQQLAAVGKPHAFAMPLIDLHRRLDPVTAHGGGLDVDIAHFGFAFRMGRDAAARRTRQELSAQTETEIGNACL